MAQTVPKEELHQAGFFPEDSRPVVDALVYSDDAKVNVLGRYRVEKSSKVKFLTQVTMLLQREWRNIMRNTRAVAARFIFAIAMSLLVGVIFWKIGDRPLNSFVVSSTHYLFLFLVIIIVLNDRPHTFLFSWKQYRTYSHILEAC